MTGAPEGRPTILRRGGPERAREMAELHGGFAELAWDEPGIASLLRQPAARGLVLDRDPEPNLAGFVIGIIAADEAEILLLSVLPSLRRRGLALRLVTALADEARGEGARRLLLEVAADNSPALGLYRKLGFGQIGCRSRYYHRRGEAPVAALQLAKAL